jgi:hypothetical protein
MEAMSGDDASSSGDDASSSGDDASSSGGDCLTAGDDGSDAGASWLDAGDDGSDAGAFEQNAGASRLNAGATAADAGAFGPSRGASRTKAGVAGGQAGPKSPTASEERAGLGSLAWGAASNKHLARLNTGAVTHSKKVSFLLATGAGASAGFAPPDYQCPPPKRLMPLQVFFDQPGLTYDSGAVYDGDPVTPAQQPQPKRKMASLKLNLSRLNPTQVIALATLAESKLAPMDPGPPPVALPPPVAGLSAEVASMATARDVAKAANDAYESAKADLVNLKQVRDDKTDLLRVEVTAVGAALSGKAKGEAAILTLSGLPLAATPGAPLPAGPISNFTVTAGDMDGSLDWSWDPEPGSKTYELQITSTDPVTGPYVTKAQPTGSSATVSGLTSGQRVWGRVRGIGSDGEGPWTDPATKIVP